MRLPKFRHPSLNIKLLQFEYQPPLIMYFFTRGPTGDCPTPSAESAEGVGQLRRTPMAMGGGRDSSGSHQPASYLFKYQKPGVVAAKKKRHI